jgi:hypothetical protein
VGTICSAALLWCLIDLDVLNDQVTSIETLGIRVCFGVLEKTEEEFSGLDGPSSAGDTELLSCNSVPSALALCFPKPQIGMFLAYCSRNGG